MNTTITYRRDGCKVYVREETVDGDEHCVLDNALNETDAGFVVHAANCHEDLVAALRYALCWFEDAPAGTYPSAITRLTQALARAQGH